MYTNNFNKCIYLPINNSHFVSNKLFKSDFDLLKSIIEIKFKKKLLDVAD